MNTQEIKVTNAQTIRIDAKLQYKLVLPSLEKQDVLPDESYDGLSKVVVDAVSLETKTISPNRDTQIITPNEALGLSSVTVEPVSLEEKSIVPTKEVQVLNPSNEYVGFSQVTVEKIPEDYIIPEGNLDIRNNGNYDVINNATVNVDVHPVLQDKVENIKAPINTFIHPDAGYDGINYVNVIASVDTEQAIVTPTEEEQILTPSENTYFDSVTVNPIPDEYIIPTGELEIIENGSYDVTEKASVNVDVQPNLGTKTINANGIYNAIDDGLDGYSSVEVATSGADLSEYFTDTITNGSSDGSGIGFSIKKFPTYSFNGTSCAYMFSEMRGVEEIDLSQFDTTNVTTMANMFMRCSKLKNIINIENLNTDLVTDMNYLFRYCSSLTNLDLSKWNTSNVTKMSSIFDSTGLVELNLTNWDISKITSMNSMFYLSNKLEKIIGHENLNTTNITGLSATFQSCRALNNLDLSKWNVSKVTTMQNMFNACANLTNLNIDNWQTSALTSTESMFSGCTLLEEIDLSHFDTSNLKTMNSMFWNCENLKIVNISTWNTSQITSLKGLFVNCESLSELDLSNFNTSKVTSFSQMFQSCDSLINLNINNFDFSKAIDTSSFISAGNLVNLQFGINLGKGFTQKSAGYNNYRISFSGCKSLSHDSLMSIINNLYDLNLTYNVANGGTLYTQFLILGETNLAKLSDEEKAIATNKGWSLS